jgi:NAD(P)-dependent dehydrogenase (short-subunit alcohol dehydrogenase family)
MAGKTVALVTGANKGIGVATARQLAEHGMTVLLGSRDLSQGEAAAQPMLDSGLSVRPVQVDVTDEDSVRSLADLIARDYGRLDVLVNNAGMLIRKDALEVGADDMRPEFETNLFGLVRMINGLLPLLQKSDAPRIVNVSSDSSMFSRATQAGTTFAKSHESFVYSASKAAINMVTVKYANAFLDHDDLKHIKINAVTPGYTATDLNGFKGMRSVAEGARASVIYATIDADGPTGRFFNDEGALPW